MKIQHLQKLNIEPIVLRALFIPCDRPDLVKLVEPGVRDTVKIATAILAHDIDSNVARVNSVIEMIGGNARKMRKNIDDAIRISRDEYEGNFGRPAVIPVDQFIYIVVALAIKELGRFSKDLNEYVVMSQISDFLDIGAIQNEYDMSCYAFLVDYFIECLSRNEKVSLRAFIKEADNMYVSERRLKNFLRKNDWYDDPEMLIAMFRIEDPAPTPAQIIGPLLKSLKKLRTNEIEVNRRT